jgi:hypothetical protein
MALDSLESVSKEGQKNPLWVYYMARTYECLDRLDDAITSYIQYDEMMPGQPPIAEKLADLRYQVKKRDDLSGEWSNTRGRRIRITYEKDEEGILIKAYALGESDDDGNKNDDFIWGAGIVNGQLTFLGGVARIHPSAQKELSTRCPLLAHAYPTKEGSITLSSDRKTITLVRTHYPDIRFETCEVILDGTLIATYKRKP